MRIVDKSVHFLHYNNSVFCAKSSPIIFIIIIIIIIVVMTRTRNEGKGITKDKLKKKKKKNRLEDHIIVST